MVKGQPGDLGQEFFGGVRTDARAMLGGICFCRLFYGDNLDVIR